MTPVDKVKARWPAWAVAGGLFILACLQLWRVYPHNVSALAPGERLESSADAFDFGRVELQLAKLYQPNAGEIQLAPEDRARLKKAAAPLPTDLSQAAQQRLQWLTQQAFPGRQGKQLGELLLGFYHWRAYQSSAPEFDAHDLERKQTYLKTTAEQLRQWFGPASAATLFGQDLDVQYYLLRRRQVLADTSLTAEQRQARLQQLSKAHKAGQLTLFSAATQTPAGQP